MFFRRRLKDDAAPPPPEIAPVATVPNQLVADMVVGIFRAHNVPAMARSGGLGVAYLGAALQPHDILVRADDLPRARDVLAAFSDDEDVTLRWR